MQAINEYQEIAGVDPDNANVYNDLGIVYFMQNKQKETIYYLEKALQLNSRYDNAMINLINAYYHFGDDKMAKFYYRKLLQTDSTAAKKLPISDLLRE